MHLGVCWYPEQCPPSGWADDAARMAALGIRCVRIGECCWSHLEPSHGRFDWAWLDAAVQALAGAGLRVVMATPTAAPPKWLVDRHPSILPVGRDGRPHAFGGPVRCDFSSGVYLEQARRITTALAQRYGRHPAVTAWQLHHEYGARGVHSGSAAAVRRFRLWLSDRYAGIAALNHAWGTVAWSMEYTSFDEIDAPPGGGSVNPAHALDFRRFASDEVVRFNRLQAQIVRQHAPGRPVLHNFCPWADGLDPWAVAADLDLAAWDSRPLVALPGRAQAEPAARWSPAGDPDLPAFHHDLCRGLADRAGGPAFWVMEQQVGPEQGEQGYLAPAAGMVRLWSWEAFAHGADMVSYARWHQVPFGPDQMQAGLHLADGQPAAALHEVAQVMQELAQVPVVPSERAAVALVFDPVAQWLAELQPPGGGFDYRRQALETYRQLRTLALDVDVVGSSADLTGYRLVVLPSLPLVPARLLQQLLAGPAQVVLHARCGSRVPPANWPVELPPGPLHALIPLRVVQAESLPDGATLAVRHAGADYQAALWREHLRCDAGVQAEAHFADGGVAVARQGRVRYLAGEFEPAMMHAVLRHAAHDAGLDIRELPTGLRLRRRGELMFVTNRDARPHELPMAGARWLVGGPVVAPHGVAIAHMAP